MALLTSPNQGGGMPLEAGRYTARITHVEPWEDNGTSKFARTEPQERLTLRVKGYARDDGSPLTVSDWITLYANPGKRSKVYKLWSAVFFDGAAEIPEGTPIDTDELEGKDVDFLVGPKKEGEGNTITGYMPTQKQAVTAGSGVRRVTEKDIDEV